MATVSFDTFDPSPYQVAPRGTLEATLTMVNALLALCPEEPPEQVGVARDNMQTVHTEVSAELVTRQAEKTPFPLEVEAAIDNGSDDTWFMLDHGLARWQRFAQPGLDEIAKASGKKPVAHMIARGRALAERATKVRTVVFGDEGLTFTTRTYAEQVTAMRSRLSLIEEKDLAGEIEELVGPDMLPLLHACQTVYEDMTRARMSRSGAKSADLRALLTRIQRAVQRYGTAVVSTLDEEHPESLKEIIRLLTPMDVLRAAQASGGSTTPAQAPVPPAPVAQPTGSGTAGSGGTPTA